MKRGATTLLIATLALACSCAPTIDYTLYRSRMPRSILVLPPLNESTAVNAPYTYLSTVTRPLAEHGYYVFPVAVIDAFMKDNGLPTSDEMHTVSLAKIREVIGADAVLYVTIEDWGQKYIVISSMTVVKARARLVDVQTGATLWTGMAQASRDSGGNDILARLIVAVVHQILASTLGDATREVSRQATSFMTYGLLRGPRHPEQAADQRGR